MLMSALVVLFDCYVLISIPYAPALSWSLVARPCSSLLVLPMRPMSSADLQFEMGPYGSPVEMEVWWSWRVSPIILSIKCLNRTGER
ncbi:hypothetical protein DPMN_143656 [Dreissena polymorpha]|uniref:Secreted protein n=1 Tax=Dreissena polymorpha TaxID=45954 RepID=A0A9D4JK82_DREPO|nr:hypothetical protein DPMN_143656 [Dreissena polymorpha]